LRKIRKEDLSAFIGSLYNGLPLAFFRFYPDPNVLREIIQKTFEIYEQNVEVKYDCSQRLWVHKKLKFAHEFKIYTYAYVISKLSETNGIISKQIDVVALDDIKKVAEKLFKFDERLESRIKIEIHNLKMMSESIPSKWCTYCHVKEFERTEPDKRNFLAHAGFEWNMVEVMKKGEKNTPPLCRKCCWNIKRLL